MGGSWLHKFTWMKYIFYDKIVDRNSSVSLAILVFGQRKNNLMLFVRLTVTRSMV